MPFVFGYRSLVDRRSFEASLGRRLTSDDGPRVARLQGYRRAWNVAGHSSRRADYSFADADGQPWAGWIVFLGLECAPGQSVLGAAYRVADHEFDVLDEREAARSAAANGTVMARYLRLVDRAYRSLGERYFLEHLATFPELDPFRVQEVTVAPIDGRVVNHAVDPKAF